MKNKTSKVLVTIFFITVGFIFLAVFDLVLSFGLYLFIDIFMDVSYKKLFFAVYVMHFMIDLTQKGIFHNCFLSIKENKHE